LRRGQPIKDKREIDKDKAIEKDNIKVEGKPQPQNAKRDGASIA
jgi:hypothetical protein